MNSAPPQSTIHLTAAQALVKYLQVQYSSRDGERQRLIHGAFGIFGHGNVAGLAQALQERGADLPYFQPCNEQSMVHTASGFAKANRRLSTFACMSSIGPGSTNMVTGAATATVNRLPVLLVPADYYATRHQGPVLQQLEHPVSADLSVNDCFRPVSRFFDRISRPEQLLTALPEAMRVLTDPAETGAVTIAMPQDVQSHAYDYPISFFEEHTWQIERRLPDPQQIEQVISLLKAAKRPLIVAGGGVLYSAAEEALLAFAETCGIPVGETFAGKGAIPGTSALSLGGAGVTGTEVSGKMMSQADLVICIGTRLTDFTTGSHSAFNHPEVKFVAINVCGHDAYKLGAVPVVADARQALVTLTTAAAEAGIRPHESYLQEIADAKQSWQQLLATEVFVQHSGEMMNQLHAIKIVNDNLRAGDTIIAAAGGPPGDLHQLWDVGDRRHCHLEFGYSCMGYEIPAGLGVRMHQQGGEVYVFIGDGTYLMNPTELVTAMQENLKITLLIADNHGYQIIRRLQMYRSGVSFGNEFRARNDANLLEGDYLPIDLAKNAASMGAQTWKVSTPEELNTALDEARQASGCCAIVMEIEKHRYGPPSGVWWDVASAEVSEDNITREARADYEQGRAEFQRFYY